MRPVGTSILIYGMSQVVERTQQGRLQACSNP